VKALRVKVAAPHQILEETLERAVERGMNRCDKYTEEALTDAQRGLLLREVVESFWIALEDAGLEVK
jgi:hypothetical protein